MGGGGVGLTKTVAVIFDFCSSKLFSFSSFSSLSSFFLSDLDLVGRPAFSAFMASRVFPVLRFEGTPASERGDDGERERERERERAVGGSGPVVVRRFGSLSASSPTHLVIEATRLL